MKYLSALCLLFLCVLMSLSATSAYASSTSNNGWSSSGGDDVPNFVGAAWFLGNAPLTYCIERNPTFSVQENEVIAIVDSAIATWKNYYQKNKAQLYSSPQINFNLSAGKCDGKESLRILLGVMSAEVTSQKARYFNPFGFSVLQDYNRETNLGHGFIWLADPAKAYPSSHSKSFYAMVLHELGHVFGNDHVDGTIMTGKIAQTIANEATVDAGFPLDDPTFAKFFTQIDGKKALFFEYSSQWSYSGIMPNSAMAKLFTGKSFNGNLRATFSNSGPIANGTFTNYILKICDQNSCSSLSVMLDSVTGTVETNSVSVFKAMTKNGIVENYSRAYELTGTIKDTNGGPYKVLITLNLGDLSPVRLRVIYNNGLIDLFTQGPISLR